MRIAIPDGSESLALASGEEEIIKILVAKCPASKCIFAHVVPQKGVDTIVCGGAT